MQTNIEFSDNVLTAETFEDLGNAISMTLKLAGLNAQNQ